MKQRRRRIERLSRSLRESSDLLVELEGDMNAGQQRAAELQEQIDKNTALAALTAEQAEAMRSVLGEVVGASDRRSFWVQIGVNAVFFGMGVVTTLYLAAVG
jgi:hypothetical protein